MAATVRSRDTSDARGPAPGVGSLPAPPTMPLEHVLAVVVAFVFLLGLGIFQGGALLPADRARFAASTLALGVAWLALTVVSGTSGGARRLLATLRLRGLAAVPICALLALGTWSFLSAAWSLDVLRSLVAGVLVAGGVVYYAAGLILSHRTWRDRSVVLLAVAGIGVVVAVPSLVGFGLDWSGWNTVIVGARNAQGPLGYANALAGLMILSLAARLASRSGSGPSPLAALGSFPCCCGSLSRFRPRSSGRRTPAARS